MRCTWGKVAWIGGEGGNTRAARHRSPHKVVKVSDTAVTRADGAVRHRGTTLEELIQAQKMGDEEGAKDPTPKA